MSVPSNRTPSQRTFWIRRIIVLAILVGLVWGLIALVGGLVHTVGGWFGGSKPAATSAAGSQSGNTQAEAGTKYTTCMPAGLSLQAIVGDGSSPTSTFATGANPRFWFTLTNTSSKPCYFNVGTAAQVFKVTSGSELIWTNSDCKSETSNQRLLLQPGVANNSNPITWERVRSSSTGCDLASGQSKAVGGGASYHLQIVISGLASNDVQFVLN
jgi:hypothetical protein